MKRLVAVEPHRVAVVEEEIPRPGPNDVLVKARRSLISPGSELNRVRALPDDRPDKYPNYDLGYALAGEVVEVGSAVTQFQPGDRVVTLRNHCEYVVSPASGERVYATIPLPPEISWDQAPFCIWGRSLLNWTIAADIQLGECVVVMGLGLVGLLMTQMLRLRGPGLLIGVDLHPLRLELGKKAGADQVISARESDSVAAVQELTGGGADCVIHTVAGPAVRAFEDSQRMARSGGRVVLIGIHSAPLTILRHEFLGKNLIGGNTHYDYDHRLFDVGVQLIASGQLPVLDLVTHREPFTRAPEVYAMLDQREHEAGAVLFLWDEESVEGKKG
jgi:threonine dehydrogenase-like Zn-dependent dehydrogenase